MSQGGFHRVSIYSSPKVSAASMTPSENVSPRTDVPVTMGRLQTQVRPGGVLGHYLLLISFSSPACTLFGDLVRWLIITIIVYFSISSSVCVGNAELHVSLELLSACYKICLLLENIGALTPQMPHFVLLSQAVWPLESGSQTFIEVDESEEVGRDHVMATVNLHSTAK